MRVPAAFPSRLVLLMLSACAVVGCGNGTQAPSPPRPVLVTQPTEATQAYTVFPGEVRARHEPALGFRVGGKILRRLAEVGERVEPGQTLAELDPDDMRLQAQAAAAQLAAARAELDLARSEAERHAALLARRLISESLHEARQTQLRAAQARVGQAEAQLDVARNQAGYARLQADVAGVVMRRLAEAGQVVAAGQTVYVIAADGEREVAIDLPEQDIGHYAPGQRVMVSLWSRPDQPLQGTLRELAPAADPASRTYAARIRLEGGAQGVELGQSARVIFPRQGATLLELPLSAVSADAQGAHVWVIDPSGPVVRRREVEVARFGDETAILRSGLGAGVWVVSAGGHLLAEGQPVRPVDRDNRAVAVTAD
ncbi:MAG: efflux RND transporter periplasmic adaptor subunit [Lysobacteraceae bacterium]